MSEQIKRVNRELKFKGTIIDFYQDTMEINGDHTVVWDFIKHKGAAAVVPVTEDGKILMVRQYRNALERYTLEIPAGALDEEGEPGFKCAARELEEETGYKSEELEWLITLRTTVAFCNEKIEVYVAKNLIPSRRGSLSSFHHLLHTAHNHGPDSLLLIRLSFFYFHSFLIFHSLQICSLFNLFHNRIFQPLQIQPL